MKITDKEIRQIESEYKELITFAKKVMLKSKDYEHAYGHQMDVVNNTIAIMRGLDESISFDPKVCIIGAYWHDVGRFVQAEGHEEISAGMLELKMKEMGYGEDFITACSNAIRYHKWNMTPITTEGLIVKDADKLGFIGKKRWQESLKNCQNLTSILSNLQKLRNVYLYFKVSRDLYDKQIVDLVIMLNDYIYKGTVE